MKNSIECRNCDSHMVITRLSKHNQGFGFLLFGLGLFSLLFGLPFGILLIVIGFYFCIAKEDVWFCDDCKTTIPRADG